MTHKADAYVCFLIPRPDLKLILMSATLNAEMFSQYFGEFQVSNFAV